MKVIKNLLVELLATAYIVAWLGVPFLLAFVFFENKILAENKVGVFMGILVVSVCYRFLRFVLKPLDVMEYKE